MHTNQCFAVELKSSAFYRMDMDKPYPGLYILGKCKKTDKQGGTIGTKQLKLLKLPVAKRLKKQNSCVP